MSITEDEKKWKAESDARTITEAAAIQADPKRLKAAQDAAKRMSKEELARAKAMKDLSDGDWPLKYDEVND